MSCTCDVKEFVMATADQMLRRREAPFIQLSQVFPQKRATQALIAGRILHNKDQEFIDLVRGVSVSTLIASRAQLFDNSIAFRRQQHECVSTEQAARDRAAAEKAYLLSRPSSRLHTFVSHCWSDSRMDKWYGLILYFRLHSSMRRLLTLAIISCLAQLLGWEPPGIIKPRLIRSPTHVAVIMSCVTFWCGSTICFFTLFFGGDKRNEDKLCFLDRACIHQTDESRKRAGIRSIGVFVTRSDFMVVLWTPQYFTRLWCIFELACNAAAKGDVDSVLILPLSYAKLILAVQVGLFVAPIPGRLGPWLAQDLEEAQHQGNSVFKTAPSMVIATMQVVCNMFRLLYKLGISHVLIARLKEVLQMREQLSRFRCRDACATDPSDRRLILDRIDQWFGSADAFDSYVQNRLSPRLLAKHGRLDTLLPLWAVLATSLRFLTDFLDALPYQSKDAATIADLFLQLVPGFLLATSLLVALWSILACYLLKLEKRTRFSKICIYLAGGAIQRLASFIAFDLAPVPLTWTGSLSFKSRACYALLPIAFLWWHEIEPRVCALAQNSSLVRRGDNKKQNGSFGRKYVEQNNNFNAWLAAQIDMPFGFIEASFLLLAIAAGTCLLAGLLLPSCPPSMQDMLELVCDLPCGILRIHFFT